MMIFAAIKGYKKDKIKYLFTNFHGEYKTSLIRQEIIKKSSFRMQIFDCIYAGHTIFSINLHHCTPYLC